MNILWHMPTLRRSMCGLSIRAIRLANELVRRGDMVTFAVSAAKTDVEGSEVDGIPLIKTPAVDARPIHWSFQAQARSRSARRQVSAISFDHDLFISCQPEAVVAYRELNPRSPLMFVCGGTTLLHDAADRTREIRYSGLRRACFALDRRLKTANERAAFHAADAIVFDSESTCGRVIAAHRVPYRKCHPVHGGVNPSCHRPPSDEDRAAARFTLGIAPREIIALWTGRISIEKNLEVMIDAMGRCRRRPDRLMLVGAGEDAAALRARADALGLGDVVQFMGRREDVQPFLHAADLFIFPSVSESFGGSLAEAMACGLPCIALRPDEEVIRNASAEILDHGHCGLLVDRNEAGAFAEVLDRLVDDPSLRSTLGGRAAVRAAACFSWGGAGERLHRLVRTVSRIAASSADFNATSVIHAPTAGATLCD